MEESLSDKVSVLFLILYFIVLIAYVFYSDMPEDGQQVMKKPTRLLYFIILCGIICISWMLWILSICWIVPGWPKRGQFGDMFGGLSALFTGLAFAGLIFTILMQKTQLKEAESDQERQRFENIFFQLLNSFNQIIDSTELQPPRGAGKSRAAFTSMSYTLYREFIIQQLYFNDEPHPEVRIRKKYELFYNAYQDILGHYFRTLYHIFKFIDLSKVENKQFYAHLVRAQLSSQQLTLLFYNCFMDGGKGFKQYVEKYNLLKHLPDDEIPDPRPGEKPLYEYYSNSAYNDPDKQGIKSQM